LPNPNELRSNQMHHDRMIKYVDTFIFQIGARKTGYSPMNTGRIIHQAWASA